VHCEVRRGRTGVVIACYRIAVTGWSTANALTEAVNFGCFAPGQQAFIHAFGETLQAGQVAGRYQLVPFGPLSYSLPRYHIGRFRGRPRAAGRASAAGGWCRHAAGPSV